VCVYLAVNKQPQVIGGLVLGDLFQRESRGHALIISNVQWGGRKGPIQSLARWFTAVALHLPTLRFCQTVMPISRFYVQSMFGEIRRNLWFLTAVRHRTTDPLRCRPAAPAPRAPCLRAVSRASASQPPRNVPAPGMAACRLTRTRCG
jgi:hypothetical protein